MSDDWLAVRQASSRLGSDAVRAMEDLPWFAALPADDRAAVGLVVHTGVAAFASWLREGQPRPAVAPEVFAAAPPELARSVNLRQTVQLVRVAVGVVEREVPHLAAPGRSGQLAEAVLRYSRELAFAAADVYAGTAEARGAWDERLEAGVVEALVRGDVGPETLSRATSLGWRRAEWVVPLATPSPSQRSGVDPGRLRAAAVPASLLLGEAHDGLLLVLGGDGEPDAAVARVVAGLPTAPVVVGPTSSDLETAVGPVAEALAALAAAPGRPDAPRPVAAGDLLPERVALGDATARARLLEHVARPLVAASGDLLLTVQAYLDAGASVEGAARALVVHPNTVRYRLRKVVSLVGLDVMEPRDAHSARLALVLARVDGLTPPTA